ncbi:uncharacterized protein G2W53_029684 [Senna tora]|uniref:Uncharacterized protein n=1 Tax=Senna tora TaxID=362788 RepID=A0A834T617_9FABA|nr:uncharacterized protein G2W53_029684 [Senna tora]
MVLISGSNKSALQHANDPRSKAQQGLAAHHNPHHQGNKNIESARLQNALNTNLTKGMTTTLEEFKFGFPSNGLSTTSNKWWGSSGPDDSASKKPDCAGASKHNKGQVEERAKENAGTETCETGKDEETSKTLQGTALLKSIRKRAAEEGREALKLGVSRGYGGKKIGKREKILLLQIFRSSLPRSWLHDS